MTNEEAIFIPKKPQYTETQCVRKWDCPNCRSNLYYIQYGTLFSGIKCHYCNECGQRIDWEVEE